MRARDGLDGVLQCQHEGGPPGGGRADAGAFRAGVPPEVGEMFAQQIEE
jgi:hypothetical protein